MKSLKFLLNVAAAALLVFALSISTADAQERGSDEARVSPNAAVSQTIGTTEVSVTYGRPGIKERTYFAEGSDLAPTGAVWRTGANESAVITFSDNVMFGGEEVEAGTYSLYSIPGTDEWTIILNHKLSWGTQYDEAEDYIRVTTDAINNDASNVEWFEIYFDTLSENRAHMNLHWGTTKVAVPISTPEM